MDRVRRIGRDLRQRRNIDAYVVAAAAVVVSLLSLLGDVVSDDVRWSVLLAALALLVYQVTVPRDDEGRADRLLHSRAAFDDATIGSRFKTAKTVWVFAPSGVNLLTGATADALRRTVLARPDGLVRVVVLDPDATEAVILAARQLDEADQHPVQTLRQALPTTVALLGSMVGWRTAGTFEYRLAPFNPGFSLFAIDPHERHGTLIVEFHGQRNDSVGSRMHLELRRPMSEHWYEYWTDQFDDLWSNARDPAPEPAPEPDR